MSSRGSIAGQQRNTSRTGRTPITPSSACCGVMVQISWTSAPIVRIEARQDFKLNVSIVAEVRGQYTFLRKAPMNIPAGKVLHFVQSDLPGWYYIVQMIGGELRCSCPAHHNPQAHGCKHLDLVEVYCQEREQQELAQAGEGAHVDLVEFKRGDHVYLMFRVVSPAYIGHVHYLFNNQHKAIRYPRQDTENYSQRPAA